MSKRSTKIVYGTFILPLNMKKKKTEKDMLGAMTNSVVSAKVFEIKVTRREMSSSQEEQTTTGKEASGTAPCTYPTNNTNS